MHISPAKLEKNFRRLPPPFPLELSVTRSLSFLTALSRPLFHLQSLKFEVVSTAAAALQHAVVFVS